MDSVRAAMNKLITIPISHFCEKARWALDRAGIPYRERAHMQCLHWVAVKRAGGGRTVPVLVTDDAVLSDSVEILDYADAHAPADRRLYSEDPVLEQETRALERDFNARLGPQGRRWLYDGIMDQRHLVKTYGPTGVPAWQRAALPVAIAPVTLIINRYFDITPETVVESLRDVRATFDEVGERLADGRPYLMGDRFSAADLTFSALSAPVTVPSEYGVPLPGPDELPEPMAEVVRELRAHPAGAHALAMFARERH